MIKRAIEPYFKHCLRKYPIVALTGPRQFGKTTLCRFVLKDKPYVSFENPDLQILAQNDPRAFLQKYSDGAIFDEVQGVPHILSYLQQIVDEDKRNGQFVLTGSQNLILLKSVQQSLAGRVTLLNLLPFSSLELGARVKKSLLNNSFLPDFILVFMIRN